MCPKRWKTTTITDSGDTYPPDAVNRAWDTCVVDAVWVGDITYLRTWEGWLYLAIVLDACSRRVIGWAISDHLPADMVNQTAAHQEAASLGVHQTGSWTDDEDVGVRVEIGGT